MFAFLLVAVTPAFSQNLISYGDFEYASGVTTFNFETDYVYYGPPPDLTQAGVYHVKRNPHDYHSGFFDMHDHTGNNGKFFIANGYGENSTNRVWSKTVTVNPNSYYEFTFWATHISSGNGVAVNRASFYVEINDVQIDSVFAPQYVANQGYWDQFPPYTWYSDTTTQATITIYDRCLSLSGWGDDFGIDDISFTPLVTYSVTANNDTVISVCSGESVDINVIGNDVVLPDTTGAVVSVVTPPSHGTCSLINNNTAIRYTFGGDDATIDQIKYRVTTHGVYSEAWVFINTSRPPTVENISAPGPICTGDNLNVTPPVYDGNGTGAWEICQTPNGTYQPFDINNVPATYNNWYLRYKVSNDCGNDSSNVVQIHVNDAPIVDSITAPAGICAGGSFDLTAPQVTWHHVNQGTGSWEIQVDGVWQTLNNNNVPYSYNGCNIRYKAVNGCGAAYSSNIVQLTVYSTEPIDEGVITACDAIYHHGCLCAENGEYVSYIQTPDSCTIQVSWHFTLGEAYIAPVQYQEACDSYYWPKTNRTYYESNVYDTLIVSGNPQVCDSTFTLDLTINHAPSIMTNVQAPSTICEGDPLYVTAPQVQMNHSEGGTQGWEYATSANGPFTTFDPATNTLGYGAYYLRYAVINACDEAYSNVVSFHVDAAPEALVSLSGMQVCEGQTLDLPEVNVTWNNEDVNDRVAQWQMSSTENGSYTAISPTMPMQMSYDGYWLRFVAQNSCGDDIVGPVMITVIAESEDWLETIYSCDSYILPSGLMITESQVIDYETYDPCLHITHQPIVIDHSNQVTELVTSCHETYEWHGMTFNHSDETQYATVTLTNASGCDSIVELQLDFDNYAAFTDNRTACGSFVWEMKPDHVYTESVRDSVFVAAIDEEDCDTWYYLNLTLGHDTVVDGGALSECSGFVWHGVAYYEDAVIYDSLLTAGTRCDSVVAYQLHIIEPVETDTSIVACNPIWWQEHYCELEGDYQHVFQTIYGCDSLVTVHFSLSEQLIYEFDSLSCEPFQWYEYQCNTDGMTCSHLFQTSQGCDSTVVMHVSLSAPVTMTIDIQACDSYEYDGVVYDVPGVVYFTLGTWQTMVGCDSVVQVRLEINDSETIGWIHGSPSVFVASNLVSGVYRYEIDTVGVVGGIVWSLANPAWQILEATDDHCIILVTTPGANTLKASFMAEQCGEMERIFAINADYFGVEEQEIFDVQVYPNPTKGTFTIEAEGIESIRLIDMMGQVLEMNEYGRANSVTLHLGGYAPSVYLLEIKTNNGMVNKRVMLYR